MASGAELGHRTMRSKLTVRNQAVTVTVRPPITPPEPGKDGIKSPWARQLTWRPTLPHMNNFTKVLRGYDPAEVDAAVAEFEQAELSQDPLRKAAALQSLRQKKFTVRWSGYDRQQVDLVMSRNLQILAQ